MLFTSGKPQSQGVVYIFSKSNIELRTDWGVRALFSFLGKFGQIVSHMSHTTI